MSWRGWRFGLLRTSYALRVWWETDQDMVSLQNTWFWIKHPRLWLRVRHYRQAFRRGQEVIEA